MTQNKEIKIKWVSDEAEITRSVDSLQRRLQQMNKTSNQMQNIQETGGTLSKRAEHAQKAFNKSSEHILQKESRELEQRQRKESSALLKKQRELKNIEKAEGAITNEKKKQINLLKEEINLRSKAILDIENTKKQIDKNLGAMGGGNTTGGQKPSGGNIPPASMLKDFLRNISIAGVAVGGLNAYSQIGGDIATREGSIVRSQGGAVQGASRDIREQFGGRGSDAFFYANERAKAAGVVSEEYKNKRSRDISGATVRGVGGGIAGAMAGGTAGAYAGGYAGGIAGSFLGPAGTIIGGMVGSGIGAIGGGIAGAMGGSALSMGRTGRTAIFDKERYDKQNLVEAFKARQSNEAALIQQDPRKMLARDHFMKNTEKYSKLQRQLQLGDKETFGESGFIQSQMNQGNQFGGGLFQESDILRNFQSLRGSSGITGSRELTGRSTAMGRQFGIENAGSTMGKMMSAGMDAGSTDDAFKKIMAEAVSMGVDDTKMSAEMQNFTTVAADIATQGGGYSSIATKQLAGAAGGFGMGDLRAARSEFGEFQTRAGSGAGFEGQLGWGFMGGERGKKAFGKDMMEKIKSNPRMMNVLNMMSASEMEKDDDLLTGYAEKLAGEDGDVGATKEQILKGLKEKDIFKQSRTQGGEDMLKQFNIAAKAAGGRDKLLKTKEGRSLYADLTDARTASYGKDFLGQGVLRRKGEIDLASGIESTGGDISGINKRLTDDLNIATEGEKSSRAIGDKLKINEMGEHAEKFLKAAKLNTEGAELMAAQFQALSEVIKEKGGDLAETLEILDEQMKKLSDTATDGGLNTTKPQGSW